ELWGRFPVTGCGLGTFRDAFPLVQPPDLQGAWWHPHSDLLEMLATAGLVGAAILAAGLAMLVRRLARVLADGWRSEDRAGALAAFGVLASLFLHEATDFGLTMPGSAVTLAVLLGAVTSARVRQRAEPAVSAQHGGARENLPAVQALELQNVEPRPQRRRHAQGGSRATDRPDRKGAHGSAVEP